MAVGIEHLKRLELKTEFRAHAGIDLLRPYADLAISSHAPYLMNGARTNYASIDNAQRQEALNDLIAHVDVVRQFPKARQINMHFAPKLWHRDDNNQEQRGDYNNLIDSIRYIADYAARWGIEIVLENNNAYFADIPDDAPADQLDWSNRNQYFGASPQEWRQIREDADRQNVALCLDSSHICTYAHTFAESEREAVVMSFIEYPQYIKHVHWNDNYLYDSRGRNDSHLLIGKGSLPIELHRAIKRLDATILLEHFYTMEDLEEELEFIKGI